MRDPASTDAGLRLPAALILLMLGLTGGAHAAASFSLRSPDRRIEVRVTAGDRIRYGVLLRDQPLLQDATLSITIDGTTLGREPRVKSAKATSVDQEIEPVVRQKSARLRDHYNQLRLEMQGDYAVAFRAYDEGVAYRLETRLPRKDVKVGSEEMSLRFAGDFRVYYPKEDGFSSHNERDFLYLPLKDIAPDAIASLPAVVDAKGVKVAVAESDVEDYPGLWLKGTSGSGLSATFPPYPLEESLTRDRDLKVTKGADYVAVTRGTRTFPWRILGIAEKDRDLLTNPLVYLPARQRARGRPRDGHGRADRLRAPEERRSHRVGGVEDVRRPVRGRAGSFREVASRG